MPRLKEITARDDLPPEDREFFDSVAESRGGFRLPYSVFLNHPRLAHLKLALGGFIRFETSLPKDVTELAICVSAREFDCDFIWEVHSVAAQKAGVPQHTIDVIANGQSVVGLSETEVLTISLTRHLLSDHRIDERSYRLAIERWGERGVIELMATIGYYIMSACWMNGLEILPPGSPDSSRSSQSSAGA